MKKYSRDPTVIFGGRLCDETARSMCKINLLVHYCRVVKIEICSSISVAFVSKANFIANFTTIIVDKKIIIIDC